MINNKGGIKYEINMMRMISLSKMFFPRNSRSKRHRTTDNCALGAVFIHSFLTIGFILL